MDDAQFLELLVANQVAESTQTDLCMLLVLNPLFGNYLPKPENFSMAVLVTALAIGV